MDREVLVRDWFCSACSHHAHLSYRHHMVKKKKVFALTNALTRVVHSSGAGNKTMSENKDVTHEERFKFSLAGPDNS